LDGLVAREHNGFKVILPIWHDLDQEEIRLRSPILAGRLAANTKEGLAVVAAKLVRAIEGSGSVRRRTPLFSGRITKKKFLELPEGSCLLSNLVKPDLTPAFAGTIPGSVLRENLWEELSRNGVVQAKCYVFHDAAAYRAHMAQRNLYMPEEIANLQTRRNRNKKHSDFDPELVRAYVAAGKPVPASWRSQVTSLSFEDEKYKFQNVDGLSGLTNLERLDLFDIDPISIEPLGKLKNLRWLYLSGDLASNIQALSSLTKLEHLDLSMSSVVDVSPLTQLTNLRHLNLFCQNASDIAGFHKLKNLRFLSLARTKVQNIAALGALTHLRTLELWATPVKDISPLSNLTNLENLCLWKTAVDDVAPLRTLENLRTLDLDETRVEDLSALHELRNLRFLSIRGTNVRRISGLKRLPNLEIFTRNESYKGKSKIDLSQEWQIWYWTRHLSVSEDRLRELISEHGNSAATIREALSR
jgi:Leucine-rich repeat (LRR) protein